MPGNVVGKALNFGYAGAVSRSLDAIISNRVVKSTDPTGPSFGDPVLLNSDNTWSKAGATATMALFAGIAVREVKQGTSFLSANGAVEYKPGEVADVIERGTVLVVCNVGTPTAGSAVYLRITANGAFPTGVVGGLEAAADGANTILLTNAKWKTGKLDANKIGEITLLVRNQG